MHGRVVVVTGAASGIGRATALLCADRGARVLAVDRDTTGLAALGAHERLATFAADVTDATAVGAALADCTARHGRIDGLVTAAAVGVAGRVEDLDPADWQRQVDSVATSTFLCCRAAIPLMRDGGGGAIVTLGSILGRAAIRGFAAYSAAKGAIEGLTRALAADHAHERIRVNCVVPGSVDTPMMWDGLAPSDLPALRASVLAEQPSGRIAEPVELARVIAFLLSDEASFVNGTSLVADGGVLARASVTY